MEDELKIYNFSVIEMTEVTDGATIPNRHLAKKLFNDYKVLFAHRFEQVDWPHVHRTFSEKVPKLFQFWACKQVMQIAATNKYMSYCDSRCTQYPCCTVEL